MAQQIDEPHGSPGSPWHFAKRINATGFRASTQPLLIAFGLKLLGAIAIVIIGRWLIRLISKMVTKAMEEQ